MTTPRDDIAGRPNRILEGAKEALAVAKGGQPAARLHINGHAYVPATQLDSLFKDRDALQARVKEWEERDRLKENRFAEWCREIEARALRAEQERDEAYERAAIYIEQREGMIPDWRGFVAELRRLASGPEKEKKE